MRKKLTEADVLLGLANEKGLAGVREKEMKEVLPLDADALRGLAERLEAEGKLRILSFAPLSCISRASMDFLGDKILAHVRDFHAKHPKDAGVSGERLERRFKSQAKVLRLTLMMLAREGKLTRTGDVYALPGFARTLPPREEKVLAELESLWLEGGLRAISFNDIRDARHLTPSKIQALVDILLERRKIVLSKEGFFVHASWLDDVIARVRAHGRTELTVADFKAMTGLSRKFAIPLLELLDEMGVTRRAGASRTIL